MGQKRHTYLFTLEVIPMKIGDIYDALPMHCTLVPRFHSQLSSAAISDHVRPVLLSQPATELIPDQHIAFGPQRVLVTTLQPTRLLLGLHNDLLRKLNELGVHYTEADWVGDGYTPHVTDKHGNRLPSDTPLVSTAAYLVEIEYPLDGRRRFIRDRYRLDYSE